MSRAQGAREVVGIDPIESRRSLSLELGANAVFAPDDHGLPPVRKNDASLDVSVDCTGLKVSIVNLMDRTNEAVAILGVLREDLVYGTRHRSGLALLGYSGHHREAAEQALAFVLAGDLRLEPLVTHILPLTRYTEGIRLLETKEAIKVCFLPWEK